MGFLTYEERMRLRTSCVAFDVLRADQPDLDLHNPALYLDSFDQFSVRPRSIVRLHLNMRRPFCLPVLEGLREVVLYVIGQSDLLEIDQVATSLLSTTPSLEFDVRYFARQNERITRGEIQQALMRTSLFSNHLELVSKLHLDEDWDGCSLLLSRLVCLETLSLDRHSGALALTRSVQTLRLRRYAKLDLDLLTCEGVCELDISLGNPQTVIRLLLGIQGLRSLAITNSRGRSPHLPLANALVQVMPRLVTLDLDCVDLPFGPVHCPRMTKLVCSNKVYNASQLPIAPLLETAHLHCARWFSGLRALLAPARKVVLRVLAQPTSDMQFGERIEHLQLQVPSIEMSAPWLAGLCSLRTLLLPHSVTDDQMAAFRRELPGTFVTKFRSVS